MSRRSAAATTRCTASVTMPLGSQFLSAGQMARWCSLWGSTTSTACWERRRTSGSTMAGRRCGLRMEYCTSSSPTMLRLRSAQAGAAPARSQMTTGAFLASQGYDAWGAMRYTHGTILTDKLYTGQRLSGDLGLYDYKARWYDPIVGRFLMEDPIIPSQGVQKLRPVCRDDE